MEAPPESAFAPKAGMVYDRDLQRWVDISKVPFWKLILSDPFVIIFLVGGPLYGLHQLFGN